MAMAMANENDKIDAEKGIRVFSLVSFRLVFIINDESELSSRVDGSVQPLHTTMPLFLVICLNV